jgi:hypothetical protein
MRIFVKVADTGVLPRQHGGEVSGVENMDFRIRPPGRGEKPLNGKYVTADRAIVAPPECDISKAPHS